MPEKLTDKQQHLRQAGLLNTEPERVQDALFLDHPTFFDSSDLLQVRYELLRSHLVDNQLVTRICRCYGISRQTFYNLQERFLSEGSAGLLAKKPGPKGPSKLTPAVRQFVVSQIEHDPRLSPRMLLSQLEAQFDLTFHLRTLEKLLSELRLKKNA
ncbi:MAG: helix-turn-helix domain containing protein [Aestuariibacter sp.]|nr:helix-turn-helix domain containing protein [Aestuariibacter sp.]